jgi:hypothetical protein
LTLATRALTVVGLLGASLALVVAIALSVADWGPPGSPSYDTYELINRLAVVPVALMIGVPLALLWPVAVADSDTRRAATGLLVGLAAMAVGTTAEFWLFSEDPYAGPGSLARNLSYLLGTFLGGIVTVVYLGVLGRRTMLTGVLATGPALLLMSLPVAFLVLAVLPTPITPYVTPPIGIGVVAVVLLLRPQAAP